jgi:hypothetical protein
MMGTGSFARGLPTINSLCSRMVGSTGRVNQVSVFAQRVSTWRYAVGTV